MERSRMVVERSHQQSCSQNPLDLGIWPLRMRGQSVTIKPISQEQDPKKLMNDDIVNVIKAYENSLNESDTQAALALYGSDPVFMPEYSVALGGRDAVEAGYDRVFGAIKLNVSFTIHEIVEMGELAYVRTTSTGTTEILENKATKKEANNELFIFRKEEGKWKIHRYLFASSRPPAAK
jgi:uncharacterized protein (TIGR02246 family)